MDMGGTKMNGYLTTVKVQEGLYEARLINGRVIVGKDGSPLPSFTSRKLAHEYLKANWNSIKEYN